MMKRSFQTMNNKAPKITKKANYAAISDILTAAQNAGIELTGEITFDSLQEFIAHEQELLDNKAVAAQKRAAQRKVDGDALRDKIYDVLTDEFMTIADIVKALDDEDISAQMVTARLTQLASPEVGKVEKDTVTVPAANEGGKSRKVSAYRRIG
jgi:hypothetical protein